MVAAVAKIGGLEGARNLARNAADFVHWGFKTNPLIMAAGTLPLLAAGFTIPATIFSNNALNPSSGKQDAISSFFADNFTLFSDATFCGQFFQALIGASPGKLVYGPMVILNHQLNGKVREKAKAIASEIGQLQTLAQSLTGKAKNDVEKKIEVLSTELDKCNATLHFWIQLMVSMMSFTFFQSLGLNGNLTGERRGQNSAETWPVRAEKLRASGKKPGFNHWFNLMQENFTKELGRTGESLLLLNPKNWRGTFTGNNAEAQKSLDEEMYRRPSNESLGTKEIAIPLPKESKIKRLWFTYGMSNIPPFLTGANIYLRAGSLALLLAAVKLGWDKVQAHFVEEKKGIKDSKQTEPTDLLLKASDKLSGAGMAISAVANMSEVNAIKMAIAGTGAVAGWGIGGFIYLVSLLFNLDPLKWLGTMSLFGANGALVLNQPINKFLETKGIKSFLEKANISEAKGMGLTHNRALAHA
jgi:hypothetical protein